MKKLTSTSRTTMSRSHKGYRESKPPLKGCGAEQPALFLFPRVGVFRSIYFNFWSKLVGIASEEDQREKFFEVPHHRSIPVSTMSGQYPSLMAFLYCRCKGRMPHEFFYYNMLLNLNNTDVSRLLSHGGGRCQRPTQFLPCATVSSVRSFSVPAIPCVLDCIRVRFSILCRKDDDPRWQAHWRSGMGVRARLWVSSESRWSQCSAGVRAFREFRYSPSGVDGQYLLSVSVVQWRPGVAWRPVDTFPVHAQSPSLLGGRRTGVMEDVLETHAALGDKSGDCMRAFLSLVYSHITFFSCFSANNSSKPTSGSISRPICSHGQLGRGNQRDSQPLCPRRLMGRGLSQRSTYVSGFLDSWSRLVHRCTSKIWTEIRINPFLFEKSN